MLGAVCPGGSVHLREPARAGAHIGAGGSMATAEHEASAGSGRDGIDASRAEPQGHAAVTYTQPQLIPYTVHLPGFDGPLDLLLHLIERTVEAGQMRSEEHTSELQ